MKVRGGIMSSRIFIIRSRQLFLTGNFFLSNCSSACSKKQNWLILKTQTVGFPGKKQLLRFSGQLSLPLNFNGKNKMVAIGNYNELELVKFVEFGAYLDSEDGEILLPLKYVPEGVEIGDKLNVFIYRDSEDRMIATTLRPKATVGEFAALKVKDAGSIGAFLEWGLEKDLFVPFNNQREPMQVGKTYVVYIYLDESSDRITGSTKLNKYLQPADENLQEGQKVKLLVTNLTDLGYNVIIDNKYSGVLYHNEVFRNLQNGEETTGYIKKIRDDKKIDVSLQQAGFGEVKDAAGIILQKLEEAGGTLNLSDNSDPKDIYDALGMSKKTFKKAIGTLFRAGQISLQPGFIQLVSNV